MLRFKKATYVISICLFTFLNFNTSLLANTKVTTTTVTKTTHHHKKPLAHKKISQHHHTRLHPKIKPPAEIAEVDEAENNVPAYYNKPVAGTETPEQHTNFIVATEKRVVSFVRNTVSTLHYSHYKLGGHHFDTTNGVYVLDCSNFVDNILREVSPHAYSSLVNATGAETPSTQHYYDFFSALNNNAPENFWDKINLVEDLHPGDILVFRNKHFHGSEGGGHVMVVMETPIRDTDIFFVRVADSAPSRHSQDTRQIHKGGIGIGTLLLRVNPLTGRPSAYAWGLGSYWNKNVNFAMARPVEMNLSRNT
jgi:hypothetical protein